jgi:hypothetical protein
LEKYPISSLLQGYSAGWAEFNAVSALDASVLVAMYISLYQLETGNRADRSASAAVNAFGLVYCYFIHENKAPCFSYVLYDI